LQRGRSSTCDSQSDIDVAAASSRRDGGPPR
jgi:hypothetical protein